MGKEERRMTHYIDAEKTKERFLKYMEECYETDTGLYVDVIAGVNACCNLIDYEIEAVDAVPVIRCKDCKYSSPNQVYGCRIHSFADELDKRMYADDFCSLGERKEE